MGKSRIGHPVYVLDSTADRNFGEEQVNSPNKVAGASLSASRHGARVERYSRHATTIATRLCLFLACARKRSLGGKRIRLRAGAIHPFAAQEYGLYAQGMRRRTKDGQVRRLAERNGRADLRPPEQLRSEERRVGKEGRSR